jgi:hypothetical protein
MPPTESDACLEDFTSTVAEDFWDANIPEAEAPAVDSPAGLTIKPKAKRYLNSVSSFSSSHPPKLTHSGRTRLCKVWHGSG